MNGIIYHSVDPSNSKSQYKESDTIDFILANDASRDMLLNSRYGVRIEGKIRVNSSAEVRQTDAVKTHFDHLLGMHGVVEQIATEFQNVGQVELINEYPRMHKAEQAATKSLDDMNNASQQVELKSCNEESSREYCKGFFTLRAASDQSAITDGTDPLIRDMDFSFKPSICLNHSSANAPFSKTGYVKISINLARDASFLTGLGQTATSNYTLTEVRCCYYSVPANPDPPQAFMRRMLNIKTSLNSQHANLSARVPAVCSAMFANFQPSANENQIVTNNNQLHSLPALNYIQFAFADSTSSYVNYKLEDRGDQLHKFLEAMGGVAKGHNNVSAEKWKANSTFGLGLNFSEAVDLSASKFNLELDSSFDFSTNPYVAYLYFKSEVSL
tara:strand:- start:743 stop:1900 length:1158 start_codon:yes stop_codon:yes gene_type:complete